MSNRWLIILVLVAVALTLALAWVVVLNTSFLAPHRQTAPLADVDDIPMQILTINQATAADGNQEDL